MLQSKESKGRMSALRQLTFQSDELVCHPQNAKDGNWTIHTADKKFKVTQNDQQIMVFKIIFTDKEN